MSFSPWSPRESASSNIVKRTHAIRLKCADHHAIRNSSSSSSRLANVLYMSMVTAVTLISFRVAFGDTCSLTSSHYKGFSLVQLDMGGEWDSCFSGVWLVPSVYVLPIFPRNGKRLSSLSQRWLATIIRFRHPHHHHHRNILTSSPSSYVFLLLVLPLSPPPPPPPPPPPGPRHPPPRHPPPSPPPGPPLHPASSSSPSPP